MQQSHESVPTGEAITPIPCRAHRYTTAGRAHGSLNPGGGGGADLLLLAHGVLLHQEVLLLLLGHLLGQAHLLGHLGQGGQLLTDLGLPPLHAEQVLRSRPVLGGGPTPSWQVLCLWVQAGQLGVVGKQAPCPLHRDLQAPGVPQQRAATVTSPLRTLME